MNDNPGHIEYLDLIVKDLSGELNHEERERLHAWIALNDENRAVYDAYLQTWDKLDAVAGNTSRETDQEWARLEKAIDSESSMLPSRKPLTFMRIAASIVVFISVGLAIYYFINRGKYEQVVAETNIEQITLPEGTKVSLNLESSIKYSSRFDTPTREVSLAGEAFFEVQRDTIRPFIIKAGDIYVEVLGTSFNVKAYEDDDQIEVTVESGKVAVYRIGDKENQVILVRGEKAVFDRGLSQLEAMENNNINYNAWKTRRVVFEDTPMSEVVRIVNEMYHSNIQLSGDALADCPVTTEFDNQSLETILNVLATTLNLTVSTEGALVIISGEGC
jgi:ferric-dicitrate binding protein FerR (iron transport regulator)